MLHYLVFKSVPVVIEPGVAALEVAICRKSINDGADSGLKQGDRVFYVQFARVDATKDDNLAKLPFIVSSNAPHIFSMTDNIDESPFLLVYSFAGKLERVYTRDDRGSSTCGIGSSAWSCCNTIPEQIGEVITQPSVRFIFKTTEARNKFLAAVNNVNNNYKQRKSIAWGDAITRRELTSIIKALADAPVAPIVFPVAVEKPKTSLNV